MTDLLVEGRRRDGRVVRFGRHSDEQSAVRVGVDGVEFAVLALAAGRPAAPRNGADERAAAAAVLLFQHGDGSLTI